MPTPLETLRTTLRSLFASYPSATNTAADGIAGAVHAYHTASGGGGGGPATALATTGTDVDVAGAAPPTAGQVLTATDATHATWQTPAAPAGPTTPEWFPHGRHVGYANATYSAGRIRTFGQTLPLAMRLTHLRIAFNSMGGDGTDRFDVGIYDDAGALVAAVGETDPGGWGAGTLHDLAVVGGPVDLAPGHYLFAWGSKNGNISLYCAYDPYVPTLSGSDSCWGRPTETTSGALPATITLPVTPDTAQLGVWLALVGA